MVLGLKADVTMQMLCSSVGEGPGDAVMRKRLPSKHFFFVCSIYAGDNANVGTSSHVTPFGRAAGAQPTLFREMEVQTGLSLQRGSAGRGIDVQPLRKRFAAERESR